MSFQPVIPMSGVAGWQFLARTRAAQQEKFDTGVKIGRDLAYFSEKIGKVATADELVQDHRLLSVSLGAFGLEADAGAKAFIRKVLDGGTLDSGALANRLADKRYLKMAEAFGFGDPGAPNTQLSDFAARIAAAYRERQFEAAVGQQRPELRLAMAFPRDLSEAIQKQSTDAGRWYAIMGNPPLRQVMQKALGLPNAFAALDIDRQLEGFRQAAKRAFGTDQVAELARPELSDQVIRRFLVRTDAQAAQQNSPGQMALMLLQAARR